MPIHDVGEFVFLAALSTGRKPSNWRLRRVCGMGDARNLLMALAGDACLVIGGRAGTISDVCLAWLHRRPLLPLTGCGGWSDQLERNPPGERRNSPILPWGSMAMLEAQLRSLGLVEESKRVGQ